MDSNLILKAKNISKSFDSEKSTFWALSNISFDVFRGEVVGIIGKNGTGKSTLMKILAEIIPPTSGEIQYQGTILSILDIGMGFHPDFTGLENVYLNASLLGMKKSEIRSKIDEIITFSGISEFIDQPVKTYSNGMYLRLALSIALHTSSDILLLDEIISVGDAEFNLKAVNKIKEQTALGKSCIMVSHDLVSITQLCDRCFLMEQGTITLQGKPREIIENYVGKAFGKILDEGSHWEHAKCKLINVDLSADSCFIDEPLKISITYEKKVKDEIDVVLKIRNYHSVVFTDCDIYREGNINSEPETGIFIKECIVPPDLFNAGTFFIDIVLGDREFALVDAKFVRKVVFKVRDWEIDKKWNVESESIPFRPVCEWKTRFAGSK